MDKNGFVPYLIAWVIVMAFVLRHTYGKDRRGSGLVLGYCFQMWLLYWLPAFIHFLPWTDLPLRDVVLLGFRESTIGFVSFGIGALFIAPKWARHIGRQKFEQEYAPDPRLAKSYILSGVVCYMALGSIIGKLPSFSAITSVGAQLIVVGCCLGIWKSMPYGIRHALPWIVTAFCLPIVTVIGQGFIGYGAMALAVVLLFTAASYRSLWRVITVAVIVGYVGLSVYTAYMRDRSLIRASVWNGAPLADRIDRFRTTLGTVEPFDAHNPAHLEHLDTRLNQNVLVGAGVNYLASTEDFAKGETLKLAVLSMIPRLVWPDKPPSGGSNGMVTRFTGIEFAQGTSVGIGPVLELYANYGTPCVIIGFILLGTALGLIDVTCAIRLAAGHWHGFALWFLVGISFLQVSGAFAEVITSAVTSIVIGTITRKVLAQYERVVDRPVPVKFVDRVYTWRS